VTSGLLRTPNARLALFAILATAFPISSVLAGLAGASGRAGAAWFGAVVASILIGAMVSVAKSSGERLPLLVYLIGVL